MSGVLQTLKQNIQIAGLLKDDTPADEGDDEAPASDEHSADEES